MSIKTSNPLNPPQVQKYQDESGAAHDSKLQCLLANKKFAIRSFVNRDLGVTITPQALTNFLESRAIEIANTVRQFDKAILRERQKGKDANVQA